MKLSRFSWPFLSVVICLACLFFSYVPTLQLGIIAGLHLDISLLYAAALIVVGVSVKRLWNNRGLLLSSRPWQLLIVFSLYTSVASLWSTNSIRAFFTAGFLWLMVALASAFIVWQPMLKQESALIRHILTACLGMSGLFALWQILGDAIGVSNSFTLLPPIYQSEHFGVARPIGFALEPQFFASLLLAPFAWLSYRFIKKPQEWKYSLCLVGVSVLLLLTLSRGGLMAASVIAIILILSPGTWRSRLHFMGLGVVSLIVAGLIITLAASLNTRNHISGYSASNRVLNQLSLGILKLPDQPHTAPSSQVSRAGNSGYVKSSTTSRLSMFQKGIHLWQSTPSTMLFGVGTGGFGTSLHQQNSKTSVGSVANNYYLEMLAELGIIGVMLFGACITFLLTALVRSREWVLFASLAGFLIQWCFFSGNANVVHVWVIIGLSIIISSPQLQHRLVQ